MSNRQLANYQCLIMLAQDAVREFVNKSAASAASLDYVKFQAVIKSAASAASLRGGRASGRLDHDFFFAILARPKNSKKILKSRALHQERPQALTSYLRVGIEM